MHQKARHTVIPAVYLALENTRSEVLLLKRQNTGYKDGFYSLIAGHVEVQERPSEAIVREAYEEAGIMPEGMVLRHISSRYNTGRIDYFFHATSWRGRIINKEPDKCAALAFYPIDNLPLEIIPFVKEMLQAIKNAIPFSEYFDTEG